MEKFTPIPHQVFASDSVAITGTQIRFTNPPCYRGLLRSPQWRGGEFLVVSRFIRTFEICISAPLLKCL
jgi:hypothetical protein